MGFPRARHPLSAPLFASPWPLAPGLSEHVLLDPEPREDLARDLLDRCVRGVLHRALGPLPPAKTLFQQRMRMATFLNRWLEYLAEQGHSVGTLEPLRQDAKGDSAEIEIPGSDAAAKIVRRIAR